MELLPAIVLYAEVLLFVFMEKQLWRTLYTPLNCLMIPYAVVLTICLLVDGSMGFTSFYYPSIWVWVAGLAVFFVPGFLMGILYNAVTKNTLVSQMNLYKPFSGMDIGISPFDRTSERSGQIRNVIFLEKITQFILFLFGIRILYLLLASPFSPGSDGFGIALAGSGVFGHLYTILMILTIIWIYLVDKHHRKYGLYIAAFFVIALLYLVKGWLLIPIISGILLRLLMGRMRLKIKLLLGVVVFGFVFFFVSYWITMFIAGAERGMQRYGMTRSEYAKATSDYIQKHFVTYLTAGVYGLSEDIAQGVWEERDPSKVYTPFVNIAYFLSRDELVEPLNHKYIITTRLDNGTNVRSFMGTLYVYLGTGHAVVYVFLFSFLANLLFFVARRRYNLFALVFSAWISGLLFMGWFDSYVQTLNFITVPLFIILLYELCYMFGNRDERNSLLNSSIGR